LIINFLQKPSITNRPIKFVYQLTTLAASIFYPALKQTKMLRDWRKRRSLSVDDLSSQAEMSFSL